MLLVIGTHNKKKAREIAQILAVPGLKVATLDDFPNAPHVDEDGKTFKENAIKKAVEVADAIGQMVCADDSGLEVDALGGAPGVVSARYGGEHGNDARNIDRLLRELRNVPLEKRTARFKTVAALAKPGELLATVEGTLEGVITEIPIGTNGFGYDPVFFIPALNKTCAQMSAIEKNDISHRGQAFRKLYDKMIELEIIK